MKRSSRRDARLIRRAASKKGVIGRRQRYEPTRTRVARDDSDPDAMDWTVSRQETPCHRRRGRDVSAFEILRNVMVGAQGIEPWTSPV
jgi:hypothetical protein